MVKSALLSEDGEITITDLDEPELESGSVLVTTLFSEVCGTDVHLVHNQLIGVPYPIIPGHVSTGIIEKMNGTVREIDDCVLEIGDVITFLDVHETCNACWYCLVAKETTRCPKRKVYGITYSANDGLLGGWSEKIYLKPGVKILKLPSVEFAKTFIAGGCGLPTAIHAIQRAHIQLGDTVVIQGSGPVGLMCAILAKQSGAFKVILVGGPKQRLNIAREFGITETINIDKLSSKDRLKQILQLTNYRGADVVVEATGVPSAVKEGFDMIRDGGTYVIVGQYTDAGDITINPHLDINKKHLTVKGSWGSDFSHFYLAVNFIKTYHNTYPWAKMISGEYSLDEVPQALQQVMNHSVLKAVISPNK
ncbi:MAG: zinc-binding dehydrogenase [Candidatus Heimdallarchaeota archaeon]|nr:zinc-binding dehydrogenase [Candidatus Heimdallarchaeota archaeon]